MGLCVPTNNIISLLVLPTPYNKCDACDCNAGYEPKLLVTKLCTFAVYLQLHVSPQCTADSDFNFLFPFFLLIPTQSTSRLFYPFIPVPCMCSRCDNRLVFTFMFCFTAASMLMKYPCLLFLFLFVLRMLVWWYTVRTSSSGHR